MLKKNDQIETDSGNLAVASAPPKKRSVVVSLVRGVFQFVLMAAILFGGYAGMDWLTSLKQETPSRPPFKTVYTVNSVVAEKGTFQPKLTVYGEAQPAQSVELRSLVAGQIVAVNPSLKVGARIEKGAELFKIDPFAFERELAGADSNIAETTARIAENRSRINIERSDIRNLKDQLDLAQKDLERISALRERGTATARDVESRSLIVSQRMQALERAELNLVAEKSRLNQQEAILERFKWAKRQAERNISDTILRAPLNGIISEKNVAEGRLINANDMAVALYEADKLEVRFTLTDQRFGRIQSDRIGVVGRKVDVIWNIGGEEFRYPATIDRIGAQITSDRGGVEVIAVIDADVDKTALRPGAFVEIIVPDKAFEGHFRFPETALYEGDTVYVVVDGKLASRKVSLHAYDGDHVILAGEISDGDVIMTTRIAEVSNGLAVRPPDTPSEPATGNAE